MPCACPQYGSGGVGSRVGAMAGGILGDYAEQLGRTAFASFFGSGDYTLRSNSLVLGGGVSPDVQIIPTTDHSIRLIYREYLTDVTASPTAIGAFHNHSIRINPGNLAFAPWLAPIAQQYQQWKANGVVFEFRSMSTDFSNATSLGSVIMATQYDLYDPPPANKQEMLNMAYSNEAKPSDRIIHGVECSVNETPNWIKYTRSGIVQSTDLALSGDLDEFDLAIFHVATQGGLAAVGSVYGSLYVYYDITLMKEHPYNGIQSRGPLNGSFAQTVATAAFYTNAISIPTALNGLQVSGNAFHTFIANNRISFPNFTNGACWEVIILWFGTAAVIGYPGLTHTGGTQLSLLLGPQAGNTGASAMMVYQIRQTAADCFTAFGAAGGLPTGNQTMTLSIRQISDRTIVYH